MGHSVSPCHRHDNQSSLARPHQQNSTHARRVTPYVTLQSHIKDVLCLMMFWPKKCWNIFLQQILFFIWFGLNAWAPCNLYQWKSQISIQNVGNTRGCLKNFCRPCSYNVWRHICHLLKKACFKYFTFLEKNVHEFGVPSITLLYFFDFAWKGIQYVLLQYRLDAICYYYITFIILRTCFSIVLASFLAFVYLSVSLSSP